MSTQIAVRLPDDLMEFVDEQVADGKAASRADAVKAALKLARRRRANEHDAYIYATTPPDPEIEAFNEWANRHRPPLES